MPALPPAAGAKTDQARGPEWKIGIADDRPDRVWQPKRRVGPSRASPRTHSSESRNLGFSNVAILYSLAPETREMQNIASPGPRMPGLGHFSNLQRHCSKRLRGWSKRRRNLG